MNEPTPAPVPPVAAPPDRGPSPQPAGPARPPRLLLLSLALALGALTWAGWSHQRLGKVERTLVKRQDEGSQQITEARLLARQAQDAAREAVAKTTLLEARLAELGGQREQIDELMRSLLRSREDQLLAETETALRAALQLVAITGGVEPLVAALQLARERLGELGSLRATPVRSAIERDLEKLRASAQTDAATLARRLDEAVRLVDELPLLQSAVAVPARPAAAVAAAPASDAAASPASAAASTPAPAASASTPGGFVPPWLARLGSAVLEELRQLVRVSRIDQPEAMLMAPEQGVLLRENLKLKLLNARLALLSRQFDTAQADLLACGQALDRYFDPRHRRHAQMVELLASVGRGAQQSVLPRPDDTLAALAAAAAAR